MQAAQPQDSESEPAGRPRLPGIPRGARGRMDGPCRALPDHHLAVLPTREIAMRVIPGRLRKNKTDRQKLITSRKREQTAGGGRPPPVAVIPGPKAPARPLK